MIAIPAETRTAHTRAHWHRHVLSRDMWVPAIIQMYPPLARRAQWSMYGGCASVCAAIALQSWLSALPAGGQSIWMSPVFSLSLVGAGVALLIGGVCSQVSTTRRIQAASYMMCGYCGHNLSGIGEHGKCTECGASCDPGPLYSFWKRYTLFHSLARSEARPPRWLRGLGFGVLAVATSLPCFGGLALFIWDGRLPSFWGFSLFFAFALSLKLSGDLVLRHACR